MGWGGDRGLVGGWELTFHIFLVIRATSVESER